MQCVVLHTLWWDTFIIRGNSWLQWWTSKLLIKWLQWVFSYQRRWLSVWRALRDTCCGKYNWGFGISFPYCHYDRYCAQKVLSFVFFPSKRSKYIALEAQKNNPCHDFHKLYSLTELFGYKTWSSDLLGLIFLMPWDNFHVFSVTVLDIPKYPNSQNIPLFSSE